MTTRFTNVDIQPGSGWKNANLSPQIAAGENLTIISQSLTPPAEPEIYETVSVPAAPPDGTVTGIYVETGQYISLVASGSWNMPVAQGPTGSPVGAGYDGDFPLPGARHYALIGRVGTGSWFYIGNATTLIADTSGFLILAMNDNVYGDNYGSLTVQALVQDELSGISVRIGSGTPFAIGSWFTGVVADSGQLQIAVDASVPANFVAQVIAGAPPPPPNCASCDSGANISEVPTINPIQVRTANKVFAQTDLTVMSPAAPLTFTRHYDQSKLTDAGYRFMGLGWTHNHAYKLTLSGTGGSHASIQVPDGNPLQFDRNYSLAGNPFEPLAGSTASLVSSSTFIGGVFVYTYFLTLPDKRQLTFDTNGYLISRAWATGEQWTYTYDTSHRLTAIDDAYGRGLRFAYVNHSGYYDDGQLWRIADAATTSLTATPVGRYVELTYVPESSNGTPVTSPKALLSGVQDVLGQSWSYDYYGQHSGETTAAQLNFLMKRLSPAVDLTGEAISTEPLTLESLTYTLSGTAIQQIYQERGNALLNTNLTFKPNGQNATTETITNASNSLQVKPQKHLFANGVYLGKADAKGHLTAQIINDQYRPALQIDPNGNATALTWDSAGKLLQRVVDPLGHNVAFAYDVSDRLQASLDAEQRLTQYFYLGNRRQPGLILVSEDNPVFQTDMEGTLDWTTYGAGTVAELSNIHVDTGTQSLHVVTNAAGKGVQSSLFGFETRSYILTARVFVVSGVITMSCSGIDVNTVSSQRTGRWESLQLILRANGLGTTGRVQFAAGAAGTEFYVDSVTVTGVGQLILNGTTLNATTTGSASWLNITGAAPTLRERSTAQVESGSVSWHVVTDGADKGVRSVPFNLRADHTYVAIARVYVVSGSVAMLLPGTDVRVVSTGSGSWETLQFVYTAETSIPSTRMYFVSDSGAAEFYIDAVYLAEGVHLLQRQEFLYDNRGRTLKESTINALDGSLDRQVTRTYGTSGNGNGLLQTETEIDLEDAGNNVSTTYSYDTTGRVVKTQKSSMFGSCDVSFTVYDAAGNVAASICNYSPGSSPDPTTAAEAVALYDPDQPDRNRVTTYTYDSMGRRTQTTTSAGADFALTTMTVYDALSRVVRTISHYVEDEEVPNPFTADHDAFDHGADQTQNLVTDTAYNERGLVQRQTDVLGQVTLYGYDEADRLVKTIQNASLPTYDNSDQLSGDPDLSEYTLSSDADQDIVSVMVYDAAGNLIQSIDVLGRSAFTVYDALNRPVKVVRNAKTAATVTLNPADEDYEAANDPRSDSYTLSSDPDHDQVETTEYDTLGRVVRTKRLLDNRPTEQWDTTLYGYDSLGRQIRVIRAASAPGYDLAADPDLSAYSVSGEADRDIVDQTVYDVDGRVLYTEDVNQLPTWLAYDGLGRQVKTIVNPVGRATDDGVDDPRSDSYVPGTDADKDIITTTVYDSDGRVQSTADAIGRVTRYVYDSLGRNYRTVSNYDDQGEAPDQWRYTTGWFKHDLTTPIDHGTSFNDNIVTETAYDAQGRVQSTFDWLHRQTRFVYDVLGRRVMTIANYVEQGSSDPADWLWSSVNGRWEDGSDTAIDHDGAALDKAQNLISTAQYDLAGRVTASRDSMGIETRYTYDALGRRIKTTTNYVDGVFDEEAPDEDLIDTTTYNKAGQIVASVDPRGTQTSFTYDASGRQLSVTRAAGSLIATSSYTCYDKASRVIRMIANWSNDPSQALPDAQDSSGHWLFAPSGHGMYEDRDLITTYQLDRLGRTTTVVDPVGNTSVTVYDKDGRVKALIDPEEAVAQYRYDGLRRRSRVVQGYDGTATPELWEWDDTAWKTSGGTPIAHGVNNDRNIIVDVTYDKAGRTLSMREPRGNLTTYAYDNRDRRTTLTNPLDQSWETGFDLDDGSEVTSLTYPTSDVTNRKLDRLSRTATIGYGDPATTPDVVMSYDLAGNRTLVAEYSDEEGTLARQTFFTYDDRRRLIQVDFDEDGDDTVDQTVKYEYDAGGRRTKLTLPGDLDVTYSYDERGNLVSLTDWDGQTTRYVYDAAQRLIAATRDNGLRSRYRYDAGSRLRQLRHTAPKKTLGHFAYEVDRRGNRIRALEALPHPATTEDTVLSYDDDSLFYVGDWTTNTTDGFRETVSFGASLKLTFFGTEATLSVGEGPDHSIYDVYIDSTLWQSFDGYAASTGQRDFDIDLAGEGPHTLEIRNRGEKNLQSSGYVLRFKQLVVPNLTYDLHTHLYSYDTLSRLLTADTYVGERIAGIPIRQYDYAYDAAGNRTQQVVTVGAIPTSTSYTYDAANRLVSDGTHTLTYDDNGNLTDDGVNEYVWDKTNRLLSMGGMSYGYDGLGNRVRQTLGSTVTKYLLDLQPGLAQVLAASDGTDTTRYVHGPRGIQQQQNPDESWLWFTQDGLNSVRSVFDDNLSPVETRLYAPYGAPELGTAYDYSVSDFGFTGEWPDTNDLIYLRARYYAPSLGVFTSLDPFEGQTCSPMSLNGYSWVEGRAPNAIDPTGMDLRLASMLNGGLCSISPAFYQDLTDCGCAASDFLCQIGCAINQLLQPAATPVPPTPTPTVTPTTSPCSMRDQNGVNVLSATAYTETDGGGPLSQSDTAVVALMLMQVNSFQSGAWKTLGTWSSQGVTAENVFAPNAQSRLVNIATSIVNGYCASGNPLVNLSQNIAGDESLKRLAGNINARFEISIDATRADQFINDPNYPLQYVITAGGANRAIVVGGVEITGAQLDYQCPQGTRSILTKDPNTLGNEAKSAPGNFECSACSVGYYWVFENNKYVEKSTKEMLAAHQIGWGSRCG